MIPEALYSFALVVFTRIPKVPSHLHLSIIAEPAPAKFVGKMGLSIHTHCIAVAGNTKNMAPIQYKDAILPVYEVPLWR